MIDMSIIQLISLLFGTTGLVSLVTSIIVIKYKKLKEKGLAKQELEKAENLDIHNTKEIVELYKTGMEDLQNLMQQREAELSKQVLECNKKIIEYESENKKLRELVDTLQKNQVLIQTKLDAITVQSLKDCDSCSFRNECMKYKAKLYLSNNLNDGNKTNAENLHSDQ